MASQCKKVFWAYALANAPAFYAHRERGRDEVLPWDRVAPGDGKADLWDEYQKALGL